MIVSHTAQCKAAVQVAPNAAAANTTTDSDAVVADAAVDNVAATDTSVTNAAPDDAAPDAAVPDAAPNHVYMALCKALNACAHDRNVYRTLRSDFLRTLEYRGGKLKCREC